MTLHRQIQKELDNLQLQFPGQAYLSLDDYAALLQIRRRKASEHLRRKGVPCIKDGQTVLIATTDMAEWLARRKVGNEPIFAPRTISIQDEMKSRHGFAKKKLVINS